MQPWQRALADLRPAFMTHAESDLHLFTIHARPTLADMRADDFLSADGPLRPPPAEDWRGGKPIVWMRELDIFPLIPRGADRLPESTPCEAWRFTIFGRDADSFERFTDLAREAGTCIASITGDYDSRADRVVGWLKYMVVLATRRVVNSALQASSVPTDMRQFFSGVRSSNILLNANVFKSSAHLIDTINYYHPGAPGPDAPPGMPITREDRARELRVAIGQLLEALDEYAASRNDPVCILWVGLSHDPTSPLFRAFKRFHDIATADREISNLPEGDRVGLADTAAHVLAKRFTRDISLEGRVAGWGDGLVKCRDALVRILATIDRPAPMTVPSSSKSGHPHATNDATPAASGIHPLVAPESEAHPVTSDELPQPTKIPAVPNCLDSRAVGFAHEMIQAGRGINVAEVARSLGCDRTKMYSLPGFRALVKQDRASREAAKARRPRGTKDRDTRTLEAWRDGD